MPPLKEVFRTLMGPKQMMLASRGKKSNNLVLAADGVPYLEEARVSGREAEDVGGPYWVVVPVEEDRVPVRNLWSGGARRRRWETENEVEEDDEEVRKRTWRKWRCLFEGWRRKRRGWRVMIRSWSRHGIMAPWSADFWQFHPFFWPLVSCALLSSILSSAFCPDKCLTEEALDLDWVVSRPSGADFLAHNQSQSPLF